MNLSQKKTQFCLKLVDLSERALLLVRDLQELIGNYIDNQFSPGQPQQIVDGDIDFPSSTVAHLTPIIIQDTITALTNISTLPPVQRTSLRKAVRQPIGPSRD